MDKDKIIFHIDLDAFFASCEERENPQFRGKPIVVGADPKNGKGRGVVSTANYIARKFGIHSAMPISQAWRLCHSVPLRGISRSETIFLPVSGALYSRVSTAVMRILEDTARKYNGRFEQAGIDEAYLDLTNFAGFGSNFERVSRPKAGMVSAEGGRAKAETLSRPRWGRRGKREISPEALARQIKQKIYRQQKVTASVGVGPNTLIAKIASDFQKPDGLTIVKPKDVQKFLDPLPIRKLTGIGPKTESELKKFKIETVSDLRKISQSVLYEEFGQHGISLYESARGIDHRAVGEEQETKSISEEHTFEHDTDSAQKILPVFFLLVQNVLRTATAEGYKNFRTVTIKVRYANFKTHTKSLSASYKTSDANQIEKIALKLLWAFLDKQKIRLIGFRVSRFFVS